LGVADKLGLPYAIKRMQYSQWAALPNWLFSHSVKRLENISAESIHPPWPELLIAAGRRTVPIARYIKKHALQTKWVQLMWPGVAAARQCDMVVVPVHDEIKTQNTPLVRTLGAPHGLTQSLLEEEQQRWEKRFEALPRPFTAIMIGGGDYTQEDMQQLLQQAMHLTSNGSLLMTTSRRTDPLLVEQIKQLCENTPHYLYVWGSEQENPYKGFLAHADQFIVTGDSMSMCSEVCFVGKPVFIFAPDHAMKPKFTRLHNGLIEAGYAKILSDDITAWPLPEIPLDEAKMVAKHIKSLT
jgi:mitochondrial fission protein ELM1